MAHIDVVYVEKCLWQIANEFDTLAFGVFRAVYVYAVDFRRFGFVIGRLKKKKHLKKSKMCFRLNVYYLWYIEILHVCEKLLVICLAWFQVYLKLN
jgi:hypothetical protein